MRDKGGGDGDGDGDGDGEGERKRAWMTVHHSHRDPPRAGKTGRSEEKQMEGDRRERERVEAGRIFHCKRSHRAARGSGKDRAGRGGGVWRAQMDGRGGAGGDRVVRCDVR